MRKARQHDGRNWRHDVVGELTDRMLRRALRHKARIIWAGPRYLLKYSRISAPGLIIRINQITSALYSKGGRVRAPGLAPMHFTYAPARWTVLIANCNATIDGLRAGMQPAKNETEL